MVSLGFALGDITIFRLKAVPLRLEIEHTLQQPLTPTFTASTVKLHMQLQIYLLQNNRHLP